MFSCRFLGNTFCCPLDPLPNVWDLSLAWESWRFLSFPYFIFVFFLPSSDSWSERPGWHGLHGTQAAFDWRLAHGPRPRRESATLGASMHAHAPDYDIVMTLEAEWMVGYVFLFPEHNSKFVVQIRVESFGNLHINSFWWDGRKTGQ